MKPGIPKGTRDFSPSEMMKRNFIFDTIRNVYQRYGYQQIETPSMENSETLLGKYGEEGDKLVFKILNSGNYFSEFKTDQELLDEKGRGEKYFSNRIAEKALRYDLTVPFARYVVMHQHEITFPFKRFQVQPVWRADRPQKGRYREFYQCDADVIGSTSMLNEVELIDIIKDVFSQLNIKVEIKINNRKILSGIAEVIGEKEKIIDITVAIDKLDKIGHDKVMDELRSKGFSDDAMKKISWLIGLQKEADKLTPLKNFLKNSAAGVKGIEEVEELFSFFNETETSKAKIDLDITLARGLNYYTGTIIEVKVSDERSAFTSSICGGGRYDDLTGIFGMPDVSGVGISFGADRIYDVLEEINGFPEIISAATKIMFVNFGNDEARYALGILRQLRIAGINAELFPDAAKMKKQMSYADDKKIPFVALVGSEEMKTKAITLKDMKKGEQHKVSIDELIRILKNTK